MRATKDILITAATELFLSRGYGVVGTSEICKVAKVNKGSFYHYFPSKSALLVASIQRYSQEFQAEFQRIAASNQPPARKLCALFDVPAKKNRAWKRSRGFAQGCLVGNMSLELGAVDTSVQTAVQAALTCWQRAVTPIIAALVEAKQIPPVDLDQGAEAVVALIQAGLLLAKAYNNPAKISGLAPCALGVLRGLGS